MLAYAVSRNEDHVATYSSEVLESPGREVDVLSVSGGTVRRRGVSRCDDVFELGSIVKNCCLSLPSTETRLKVHILMLKENAQTQ